MLLTLQPHGTYRMPDVVHSFIVANVLVAVSDMFLASTHRLRYVRDQS